MKLVFLYDFLSEVGGIERLMATFSRMLPRFSHSFGFLSVTDSGREAFLRHFPPRQTTQITRLGPGVPEFLAVPLSFVMTLFGFKLLRSVSADLFFSYGFFSSYACYRHKKKYSTPYVVYLNHPPNFLYQRSFVWVNNLSRLIAYLAGAVFCPFIRRLDLAAMRSADLVFVNSDYTGRRAREIYGIDAVVLPPPVAAHFRPLSLKQASPLLRRFNLSAKFVHVHGRLIKDKRPDLALRAFALCPQRLHIVFSGTIEERDSLVALAKKFGLSSRVHLVGRVSDEELVALYSVAECFIMSAPKEDFGLTPVEAMACGTPVVAWGDGAGPSETVVDGVTGFLARPYDPNDMRAAVLRVLESSFKKKHKRQILARARLFSESFLQCRLELKLKSVVGRR